MIISCKLPTTDVGFVDLLFIGSFVGLFLSVQLWLQTLSLCTSLKSYFDCNTFA